MQKITDIGILVIHALAILPMVAIGIIFLIGYLPIVLGVTILDYIDEIKNGSRYGKK
jgi:hypothetical protein